MPPPPRVPARQGSCAGRERVVPELEHEQRPELLAVVARAGEVLVDEAVDLARVEEALRDEPRRREQVEQRLAQARLQPRGHGDAEALLLALRDAGRQQLADGALEQHLAGAAAQLQVRRHAARGTRRACGRGTARAPRARRACSRGRSSPGCRRPGRSWRRGRSACRAAARATGRRAAPRPRRTGRRRAGA